MRLNIREKTKLAIKMLGYVFDIIIISLRKMNACIILDEIKRKGDDIIGKREVEVILHQNRPSR